MCPACLQEMTLNPEVSFYIINNRNVLLMFFLVVQFTIT